MRPVSVVIRGNGDYKDEDTKGEKDIVFEVDGEHENNRASKDKMI